MRRAKEKPWKRGCGSRVREKIDINPLLLLQQSEGEHSEDEWEGAFYVCLVAIPTQTLSYENFQD